MKTHVKFYKYLLFGMFSYLTVLTNLETFLFSERGSLYAIGNQARYFFKWNQASDRRWVCSWLDAYFQYFLGHFF
jgi:hypothetical protein